PRHRFTVLFLAIALAAGGAGSACKKKSPPIARPTPPPPDDITANRPPAPPPAARPEVQPQQDEYARLRAMSAEEIEKSGLLGEVYFEFDRAELRDADLPTLTKNAEALKRFDFLRITVEGHCDERGTVEYNLALGERRARAAYDYLVSLGVPASRLKTVSYGKEVPACQASTEECWQKNRRAHFTVTGKTQ
ncbi:MAG: peptidoglycan-associated lipoprotein Pal, partial [Burkholderiales bacterium]